MNLAEPVLCNYPTIQTRLHRHWLLYLGIVVATLCSWLMMAQGMVVTDRVPFDGIFLPSWFPAQWVPGLIAGTVALGVTCFIPVALGLFRHGIATASLVLFCIPIVTVFVGLELSYSVADVNAKARGDAYLKELMSLIRGLDNRASDVDGRMMAEFRRRLEGYRSQAADAAAGRDDSGIALRGPIYRGRYARIALLTTRYEPPIMTPIMGPSTSYEETHGAFVVSRARIAALRHKAAVYDDYLRLEHAASQSVIDLVIEIETSAVRIEAEYFAGKGFVDRGSLILNGTKRDLIEVVTGRSKDFGAYVSLVVGALPLLANLLLNLLIVIRDRQDPTVGALTIEREHAKRKRQLMSEILENERESGIAEVTRARLRSMYAKMRAMFASQKDANQAVCADAR